MKHVKIMQAPHADDFILATGHSTTVRQFANWSLKNLALAWNGVAQGLKKPEYVHGAKSSSAWIRTGDPLKSNT